LYALAFVANKFGLLSTGIIRGEELTAESNTFLRQIKNWGMNRTRTKKDAAIEIMMSK
jgi:hypothetical protein